MSTDPEFQWDVFLSHSKADKDVVRDIANRLKSDGVRVWFDDWEIQPGDSIPAKIEDGLEQSRVLVLCMSKAAFGSDWAQLESHTFRFKDPLNHNRRFIPLRLDDTPAKGSLGQFSYIAWSQGDTEEYHSLLKALGCRDAKRSARKTRRSNNAKTAHLSSAILRQFTTPTDTPPFATCKVSPDESRLLTGHKDGSISLWDLHSNKLLKTYAGHRSVVLDLVWVPDGTSFFSASRDRTAAIWDIGSHLSVYTFRGHSKSVTSIALSPDKKTLVTGSSDRTVRHWNIASGYCESVFAEHTQSITSVLWGDDGLNVYSGSHDGSIRCWDVQSGVCDTEFRSETAILGILWRSSKDEVLSFGQDKSIRTWNTSTATCTAIMEGHTKKIFAASYEESTDRLLTCSFDRTVRLWNIAVGSCESILRHKSWVRCVEWLSRESMACSVDYHGVVKRWYLPQRKHLGTTPTEHSLANRRYINAKVLLVGNSAAGKTGLSNRLALDTYKETDSTVGAWATQWKLPLPGGDDAAGDSSRRSDEDGLRPDATATNVEREVWLWDFGGQADQRLIHQLYMDQTQVAALVFDPQKDDVFETLGQWDRDLSRADMDKGEKERMTKLLVAGRCDAGGLRVARSQVEDFASERGYDAFVETSAKTDAGCEELKQAIIDGIKWENIPWRSSPVLFKRLKDEIIRLKDEDRVLLRFNELREVLSLRMQAEDTKFTDAELKAVVGLLAGPGVVWELEFGSWVLLQPERINAYAQAVIQTVREDEHDRGCILEERVLNGDLTYHASIPRLPPDEERFVLLAMHQILVERGLCIRQLIQPVEGTDGHIQSDKPLLIFPSYYRRERPELVGAPAIVVSYQFNGFLDEIYATLVVKLHHTTEFDHDELWRYAADFKSKNGHSLGVRLTRRAEGEGELDVYFGSDVPVGERIIFSKYVHEHLLQSANDVFRLRHYVCPHCGTPVGNRQVAMRKLEEGKKDIPCVECDDSDKRVPLWDELEELFADDAIKQRVRELNEHVRIVLDTESKERALVGEVISTVALAGQICREIQVSDWGLDAEVEFKNDDGQASAKRLWLQLKSGDSFLTTRKKDGAAIFKKFNQRQAEYWMKHAEPVMLLIRNSKGEIQWMDIREELRRVTDNGEKQVRQIVFDGNRFDVMSVRRWRDAALAQV